MPKRLSVTFDDDAADLLPKLAAQAGKPHRMGQYLSELIRAAAVTQVAEQQVADAGLAEMRQMIHGLTLRVAQLEQQIQQPAAPRSRRRSSPAYYTAPTPTVRLLTDVSPEYDAGR